MASLVLGAAGAYIGSFFGPLGTSIGWAVGSAIGTSLEGKKGTEGPRLTDLKLQTSSYGATIPVHYGSVRAAGASVIWQTDLIEHPHTSGGKGGGQKSTTFSYTCSFAVMLCEGPIIGIKRIWADNRLIWDGGATPTGIDVPLTLYLGTETQMPDPTMEAVLGAGNVPAHRGYAYIVFTDWDMAPFFNRIPQLTFEIHATGSVDLVQKYQWDLDWTLHEDPSPAGFAYPSLLNGVRYDPVTQQIIIYRNRSKEDYSGSSYRGIMLYQMRTYTLQGALINNTSTSTDLNAPLNAGLGEAVQNPPKIITSSNSEHNYLEYQISTKVCDATGPLRFFTVFYWSPAAPGVNLDLTAYCDTFNGLGLGITYQGSNMFFYRGYLYATGGFLGGSADHGGPGCWIRRWPCNENREVAAAFHDAEFIFMDVMTPASNSPFGHIDGVSAVSGDDGFIYCIASDSTTNRQPMWKLNRDLTQVYYWNDIGFQVSVGMSCFAVIQGHLLVQANSGGAASWVASPPADMLPRVISPGAFLYKMKDNNTFAFVDNLTGLAGLPSPIIPLGDSLAAWRAGILDIGGETTLAAIVTDISERCNFTTADLDVTDIPDRVHGYVIGQQMTARAAIEGLMPAFDFDAVESDLQVKFRKRGHDPIADIPFDDLGATTDTGSPPAPLPISRMQEFELPRRMFLKYFNLGAAYQDGTQLANKEVTFSQLDVTVNVAVVMTDQEALNAANRLIRSAWAERMRFQDFATPIKWAHLEPTDVVYVNGYPVRITGKTEEGGICKWQGALSIQGVRIQGAPPALPQFVPKPIQVPQQTDLLLLDLPLITDSDPPFGHYVAMAGQIRRDWVGADLDKSIDGGANYTPILTATDPDTFGRVENILGDYAGGNFFDEGNALDVILTAGSGPLASTSELGALNGANMFLVGDEIVGAKNCTLVSPQRYQLTGLLRGRRGSEWAMTGHVRNERFVALPTKYAVEATFDEIGLEFLYKPVTHGDTLAHATAQSFNNLGATLKPYSPCHLFGYRNPGGDIILNWTRRTRLGGAWRDSVDVALSEPGEQYLVRLFTDSSYSVEVVRYTVTGPTFTFTAANQTSYFGGLVGTLYWDVSQVGNIGSGQIARGVT